MLLGLSETVRGTPTTLTAEETTRRMPIHRLHPGGDTAADQTQTGGRRRRPRPISTAPLSGSPRVHAPPIEQVVYLRPYPDCAGGGLISGRASHLDAFSAYPCRTSATQQCPWRNNWYTGGPSIPVLSY